MNNKQSALQKLCTAYKQHLGLKEGFTIGCFTPEDSSGEVLDFLKKHSADLKIPTYKKFEYKFSEKFEKPTKEKIEKECKKFPFVPDFDKPILVEKIKEREKKKYENNLRKQREFNHEYSKNRRDYIRYLKNNSTLIKQFFETEFTFSMNYFDKKHSYITGGTGAGKSELMKYLIHSHLKEMKSSVVLIEPAGDLASQVAHLKENINSDRLIYFDPFLQDGKTPVINPFDFVNTKYIDMETEFLLSVFEALLAEGGGYTVQMTTVLRPIISTLLYMGGQTLVDLLEFVNIGRNDWNNKYILAGHKSPIKSHREFFREAFFSNKYQTSKHGIYTKIQNLLSSSVFYDCTVGKSTINIEEAVKQKKLIVFNLAKGKMGHTSSNMLGRFIIAKLQSFALSQADILFENRTSVYMYVDECHNYLSATIGEILKETRKYFLFANLAQQIAGDNMDGPLRKSIFSNTDVKITGSNSPDTTEMMAKETRTNPYEFDCLEQGQFYIHVKKNLNIPVKVHSDLIDDRRAMSDSEWEGVKKNQIEKYYKTTQTYAPASGIKNSSAKKVLENETKDIDFEYDY